METLDVLKGARNLLAKGYLKYRRNDGRGNFCALGAIHAVTGGRWGVADRSPAVAELEALLGTDSEAFVGYNVLFPGGRLANYNNNTDQARTVALFDRAIAKLEAEMLTIP